MNNLTTMYVRTPRKNQKRNASQRGFGMIEAVIGIAVSAMILAAFSHLVLHSIKLARMNNTNLKATYYAREMLEVAKDLERSDWSLIADASCSESLNQECHPVIDASGDSWELVSGDESFDGGRYTRSMSLEEVYRDSPTFPNEIVTDGSGVPDPDTKKVIARIEWFDGFNNRDMTLETYIYRF